MMNMREYYIKTYEKKLTKQIKIDLKSGKVTFCKFVTSFILTLQP